MPVDYSQLDQLIRAVLEEREVGAEHITIIRSIKCFYTVIIIICARGEHNERANCKEERSLARKDHTGDLKKAPENFRGLIGYL